MKLKNNAEEPKAARIDCHVETFQAEWKGIGIQITTLGTYSIIPTVYLWREVSRALAVYLFAFFVAAGIVLGLLFAAFA